MAPLPTFALEPPRLINKQLEVLTSSLVSNTAGVNVDLDARHEMLLDVKKTAGEVKIQRIEINLQQGLLMSINRTSLIFAQNGWWRRNNQEHDLSVLNFWVGREKQVAKEEGDETGQPEKKAKLS